MILAATVTAAAVLVTNSAAVERSSASTASVIPGKVTAAYPIRGKVSADKIDWDADHDPHPPIWYIYIYLYIWRRRAGL